MPPPLSVYLFAVRVPGSGVKFGFVIAKNQRHAYDKASGHVAELPKGSSIIQTIRFCGFSFKRLLRDGMAKHLSELDRFITVTIACEDLFVDLMQAIDEEREFLQQVRDQIESLRKGNSE